MIADLWQRGKIARYEGRSSLKTWLGTVVSHAAINAAKAARTREPREEPAIHPALDPEPAIEDTERSGALARLLAESIARQPAHDRLLILLYYEQGLTLDEIGPVILVEDRPLPPSSTGQSRVAIHLELSKKP